MKSKEKIITLTEGAVCIALALALSYFKLWRFPHGGSVDLVMVPLIVFAVYRGGALWGIGAGFVYGTLKYFLAGGFAITWSSILLDYAIAYAAVGLAGVFKGKGGLRYLFGALAGGIARFIIHFISGITIYAINAPTEIVGITTASPWLYSLVYNGIYMFFNILAAVVLSFLIGAALGKVRVNN